MKWKNIKNNRLVNSDRYTSILVIDIIISTIDMVSANRFTWKDFSTSGFTLANIITMYRFT